MANGRLKSTLIPPYSAAEIYNNNSGSPGSITINGQVISATNNSFVSVAATSTDYSSTVSVSIAATTTCVPVDTCFKSVVYCCNATEDYLGYYAQTTGIGSFSPTFVTCTGCVYSESYNVCCCPSLCCVYNLGVVSTAINPEVLVSKRCSWVISEYACGGIVRYYNCSTIPCVCDRAKHFVDVCVCGSCCTATICNSAGYVSAIDNYSSQNLSIALIGPATCACTAAFYPYSISIGSVCFGCSWANALSSASYYYYLNGPALLAGCEVLGVSEYGCYRFRAYDSACSFAENSCRMSRCFAGQYIMCVCCVINPIKWMTYNPTDCLNYIMSYSGTADDGIYKLTGLSTLKNLFYTCNCCILSETLSSSTIFTKVSSIPSVFCSISDFRPSRLFQIENSKWILSVCNGSTCTWSQYVTCDLINWSTLCCCSAQLTPLCNSYSTDGNGIIKTTNNYFNCINCSGTLDYCVCLNQYTRTGVVVSNGDRLYMNNYGPSPIAVNVWGYEG